MGKRCVRVLVPSVAGLLIGVGTITLTPTAFAAGHDYADCDGFGWCAPDNSGHTWCFGASTDGAQDLRASMRWAINNMTNTTQMSDQELDACNDTTDVKWQRVDVEGSARGRYSCQDEPRRPRVCTEAEVRIRPEAIQQDLEDSGDGNPEPGELDLNRDKTVCHELGHSLGFDHHDLSYFQGPGPDHQKDCTVAGHVELDSGLWRRYNDRHRQLLNDELDSRVGAQDEL